MESDSLLRPLDPQGDASLRTGIVRYLHDFRGIEAAPEQIIPVSYTHLDVYKRQILSAA